MLSRSGCLQRAALSAQASLKADSAAPALQIKKLDNGLVVAGLDNGSRLTTVGVVAKAGARYESYETAGITHALRSAFGLASDKFTGFGITRHIQQAGANVTVAGTRDYIMYSTQLVRDGKQQSILDYMFDAIACPKFRKWETPDAHGKVAVQVAQAGGQVKAMENLHKAAYRADGLANSIMCPDYMVGKHSDSALAAYHKKHVTAERSMLVGLNMDFNHLLDYATSLNLESGAGPSVTEAKFFGGNDVRTDAGGSLAHIAIAADAGNASPKEVAANYILKVILGNGQSVKYGNQSGKLGKALGAESGADVRAAAGFHNAYVGGASLIGAFISTEAAAAGANVAKVAAALRSVAVTPEEFAAAKKLCLFEVAEMTINPIATLENIVAGTDHTVLEQVTLADVQAAAKKLSNAKLSVGAVGNLSTVPYADTL